MINDDTDYQYENDLETMKTLLIEQICPGTVITRMTRTFRAEDDKIWAIHINRSASEARDYFFRDEVTCETLRASGHRLCFKNIRDIRDFLAFFDERMKEEADRLDAYCDEAYSPAKKEMLALALKSIMAPVIEERLEVNPLTDEEVPVLTRHLNFIDKE